MKEIKKIICIGANCIAADFTHSLGVRHKSPVDNIANFNIWNAYLLFSGRIAERFFKKEHQIRKSTKEEMINYHYSENVFTFIGGFSIVHNNFNEKIFKNSLRKRIRSFRRFYKRSLKRRDYWYIYSLNYDDKYLTDKHFEQLLELLPKCCTEHLICLGIRGKNQLFGEYFKYYIEIDRESNYKWHDKLYAQEIANLLYKKYSIRINYS